MALTQEQLPTLKSAILAETNPEFVAYREADATGDMAAWYNVVATPSFVVANANVQTALIGKVINYVAYAALTDANVNTLSGFLELNPSTFDATKPDVREMLAADSAAGIFSGALGGKGAETRAALNGIMLRNCLRGERLYATGTGTPAAPGNAVFVGDITEVDVVAALQLP